MTVLIVSVVMSGCSKNEIVIPSVPPLEGNRGKDLNNLLKFYVVPIEAQRR